MPKWISTFTALLVLACAPANAAPYSVNDLVLGEKVAFDSAAYREYRCGPSDQFDGFTWCQRTRQDRERRGPFKATYSILHSRDGKIAYANRQQDSAFFGGGEVDEAIRSYSRKVGSQPQLTRMPRRSGAAEGVIAMWGHVSIEPLDGESIKILADGKSPKKGFLVDFIGNLIRSAQDGLPIYRITGGPGFIWVASYDQRGRGTLRFTAIDTSVLSPKVTAIEPSKVTAVLQPSEPTEQTIAAPLQSISQLELVETKKESTEVERPQSAAQLPLAPEKAQFDVADTKATGDGLVAEAEIVRLKSQIARAYAIIAGLLAAFIVFALISRRRKPASEDALLDGNSKLARDGAKVAPQSPKITDGVCSQAKEDRGIESGICDTVQTTYGVQMLAPPTMDDVSNNTPITAQSNGEGLTNLAPLLIVRAQEEGAAVSIVPDGPAECADPIPVVQPIDDLAELSKLRADGMLTEIEFSQLKSGVVASVSQNTNCDADSAGKVI